MVTFANVVEASLRASRRMRSPSPSRDGLPDNTQNSNGNLTAAEERDLNAKHLLATQNMRHNIASPHGGSPNPGYRRRFGSPEAPGGKSKGGDSKLAEGNALSSGTRSSRLSVCAKCQRYIVPNEHSSTRERPSSRCVCTQPRNRSKSPGVVVVKQEYVEYGGVGSAQVVSYR